MFDMNGSPNEVVDLDDALEGFNEFKNVLFTYVQLSRSVSTEWDVSLKFDTRPFESCIGDTPAQDALLSRTISLLAFAHKYCAAQMEARTLTVAINRVGSTNFDLDHDAFSHIPTILDIARLVGSSELAILPKAAFLKKVRGSPVQNITALRFGQYLNDEDIQTEAYLSIMRQHGAQMSWQWDASLTPQEKETLSRGIGRCAQKWQESHRRLTDSGPGCGSPRCSRSSFVVAAAAKKQIGVPFFDCMGMLDAYLIANHDIGAQYHNCSDYAARQIIAERTFMESNFTGLFFERAPVVSVFIR